MSKKILTALAPLAAIVASVALPAFAQATVQTQCGSVECANGATIRSQISNLTTHVQNPAGEMKCTGSTFEGTLGGAQAAESGEEEGTIEGEVSSDTLSGCTSNGVTADVKTNASAAHPWRLKVQKEKGGQVKNHILPNAQQERLQFTVQIQAFGFSVATCTLGATSIQAMGSTQSSNGGIEGTNQFVLEASNSSECGTVGTTTGDLTGTVSFENAEKEAVVIH
jgi:hypothetical protein